MIIGALNGLFVASLVSIIFGKMNMDAVEKYNANPINQALRKRATYKPHMFHHLLLFVCMISLGAIIGYFVS